MKEVLLGLLAGTVIALAGFAGFRYYQWHNASGEVQRKPLTSSVDVPATFANCTEAHSYGFYDIPRTDSHYRLKLDADLDGYACEPKH